MPQYTYACTQCEWSEDRIGSIAEMEVWDDEPPPPCAHCATGYIYHALRPMQKHVKFFEGFYEHISPEGEYITSMEQLKRVAKENGNYSRYAEDHGGLFRAKEGRWI